MFVFFVADLISILIAAVEMCMPRLFYWSVLKEHFVNMFVNLGIYSQFYETTESSLKTLFLGTFKFSLTQSARMVS